MNLINDPWIPVLREDGTKERIAPWQIAETVNPVMDIAAARPDFQGALYQFLIGLLQTTFAPEDEDERLERWNKEPSVEDLKVSFAKVESAFELTNAEGFSFLQDGSFAVKEYESISQILVGEPGVNTIKNNQDHFIHRGGKSGFCEPCCATALYALSLNGPPGGAGHMTGLIGNGPVVTLVKIDGKPLWTNLWNNVLSRSDFGDIAIAASSSVFPWMGAIKTSEKCKTKSCPNGCEKCSTFPDEKSHLHVFWGMARRIHLMPPHSEGICGICGEVTARLIETYAKKPNGIRYMGGWTYPLSPRKFVGKEQMPEPLRGNQVQGCYADWLGIIFQDDECNIKAAQNVRCFLDERLSDLDGSAYRISCYFYDMEPGQANARCWYEQHLPIVHVDAEYQPIFVHFVSSLINAAREVVKELRSQVKAAWFSRPKDAKGDTTMIDSMFWQATESAFYKQISSLAAQPANTRFMPAEIARDWLKVLRKQSLDVFDYWVLEGDAEDMDMKRIVKARKELEKKLKTTKSLKDLEQIANTTTEVA